MRPEETHSGPSETKMARFIRAWKGQFGDVPRDWNRRADPESSFGLWREFVEDNRTQIETCEVVLGKLDSPPAFRQFRSMYFDTLETNTNVAAGDKCSSCGGFKYLYAVTGIGNRRDGSRGKVVTGPGHRIVPVDKATVTTIRCVCSLADAGESRDRRFATIHREAAERHADECQLAFEAGSQPEVVDDSMIPPGEDGI